MPFIRRNGRSTCVRRSEDGAKKNGFRPCVYENRGLYIGNWENDMKQGKGKKIYKNQTIYEGEWVANKKHGFGVLTKRVDDHFIFVYEGNWIDNRYANGKLYEKDGIYDGGFSTNDGTKCGYGTMWLNGGAVYRGHWRNNEYHGIGQYLEENGNYYDGQWRNGVKYGEGTYVFRDKGQCMKGVWIDGVSKISEIKRVEEKNVSSPERGVLPEMTEADVALIREPYGRARSEILEKAYAKS